MKAIVNAPVCPLLDRPVSGDGTYPTVVDEALYGMTGPIPRWWTRPCTA